MDGLKPSKYLVDTAIQNIEGKITMKEAQSLIDSYYKERPVHLSDDERTEEADVLRKFFLKQLLHFLRMNISLYIVNSFREFTNMLERLEITILQRMNGYLTGQRLCMVVPLN